MKTVLNPGKYISSTIASDIRELTLKRNIFRENAWYEKVVVKNKDDIRLDNLAKYRIIEDLIYQKKLITNIESTALFLNEYLEDSQLYNYTAYFQYWFKAAKLSWTEGGVIVYIKSLCLDRSFDGFNEGSDELAFSENMYVNVYLDILSQGYKEIVQSIEKNLFSRLTKLL